MVVELNSAPSVQFAYVDEKRAFRERGQGENPVIFVGCVDAISSEASARTKNRLSAAPNR
jgi:hypothetical protein